MPSRSIELIRAAILACVICAPVWAQSESLAEWKPLFDGSSLQGWRETPFSGRGKVRVENGAIALGKGVLTGITRTGAFPKFNYEIRLEAMRIDGYDFFAGITFPVHDSFCSWINGGWGGMVVGLSNLDDMDAAENDTSIRRSFESGRWYALRLRVTEDRIQAWIDDEGVIDAYIGTRVVGLRPGEIELSKPLGIASYSTTARLRKLEYRLLAPGGRAPQAGVSRRRSQCRRVPEEDRTVSRAQARRQAALRPKPSGTLRRQTLESPARDVTVRGVPHDLYETRCGQNRVGRSPRCGVAVCEQAEFRIRRRSNRRDCAVQLPGERPPTSVFSSSPILR